ncbi:unnamed protein product [Parascedosporium putredinis]|uniref:Peroxisomal biogenesis factor 11 n=1 Tax=Parascedosporium putredinis TaxID=1442378 RepID=A0A9P1H7H7_9PEZI|nr:unnamed protein product [Parascedosporium putredinis]CAI7999853.1 unnamed protein product [Parascedosporium putredinis]
MSSYEQFISFGVDAFGIERFLRGVQATCQIFANTPAAASLTNIPISEFIAFGATLNLARRFIRTWRFLDCFSTSQALYNGSSGPTLELWLDITRLSLFGIYGLLETATLPDLSGVTGFGPQMTKQINLEAQKFWFAALACGIVAGASRLLSLYAHAPVPQADEVYDLADGAGDGKDEKKAAEARLKKKQQGEEERAQRAAAKASVLRKTAVDAIDMVIPSSVLRWIAVDTATVGWAMLLSTFLSGYDVWARCGVQLRQAKAAKAPMAKVSKS